MAILCTTARSVTTLTQSPIVIFLPLGGETILGARGRNPSDRSSGFDPPSPRSPFLPADRPEVRSARRLGGARFQASQGNGARHPIPFEAVNGCPVVDARLRSFPETGVGFAPIGGAAALSTCFAPSLRSDCIGELTPCGRPTPSAPGLCKTMCMSHTLMCIRNL